MFPVNVGKLNNKLVTKMNYLFEINNHQTITLLKSFHNYLSTYVVTYNLFCVILINKCI